jgi:hypothetical protein
VRAKAAKLLIAGALTLVMGNLAAPAFAQEEKSEKAEKSASSGKDKKQTKIDFEDELVEGELKKPELFYLLQKKQFNFKRLIKLREDFLPEMRRDADEIRRGRSSK